MGKNTRRLGLGIAAAAAAGSIALGAIVFKRAPVPRPSFGGQAGARASKLLPNPRLRFEPNRGQFDENVRFSSRGPGYGLFLTREGATLVLQKTDESARGRERRRERLAPQLNPRVAAETPPAVVSMRLVGARPVDPAGHDLVPGKTNHFVGSDPSKWKTDVEGYSRVRYPQAVPGVDVVFYPSAERQLEYDLVLAPGVDPGGVALAFEGVESVEVDAEGDAVLHLAGGGELRHVPPVAYQTDDAGNRVVVASRYERRPSGALGFTVGAHDRRRELIIDPVLAYTTYLGGAEDDSAIDIAVDSEHNVYVLGETRSAAFPITSPFRGALSGVSDLFVSKLDPTGVLVYSTYFGGRTTDFAGGIAVDASRNIYITGYTSADDIPTTPSSLRPTRSPTLSWVSVVAKLNPTGSALVYSTYLGGDHTPDGFGGDFAHDIAIDAAGSAYVVGHTQSTDFPTTTGQRTNAGGTDCFVSKLNPNGSALVFSTYLGGADGDVGNAVAVDSALSVYVLGTTVSTNFPLAKAIQAANKGGADAFVTRLTPSGGALVYSTYLGGSMDEFVGGIAVDSAGNAHVNGFTQSSDFPLASPLRATPSGLDAFVTKLSAPGSNLVFSTYLGTSAAENGSGIALDSDGNIYVSGTTYALNTSQVTVDRLNPAGSALTLSTVLRGSGTRNFELGGIALDAQRNVYVAGETDSNDLELLPPSSFLLPAAPNGQVDAFVARIDLLPLGQACGPLDGCRSGFCVDGVCCESACGGGSTSDCQACSLAAGSSASTNGICAPRTVGLVCRTAGGTCDIAEACDGSSINCPADVKRAAGTICRPSAGDCDVTDTCNGTENTCPDARLAAGTVCRTSQGACDPAEVCSNSSPSCPPDARLSVGTTCRAAVAGGCDIPEVCGSAPACPPDAVELPGTECRPSAGACDVAEQCQGTAFCPDDAKEPTTKECRASAGPCDLPESCDGGNVCPEDVFVPEATVCRPVAGLCDKEDTCTGNTAPCPDAKQPNGFVCHPSAGACDPAEVCNGTANTCPADALSTLGTVCFAGSRPCEGIAICSGSAPTCGTPPPPSSCGFSVSFAPYRRLQIAPTTGVAEGEEDNPPAFTGTGADIVEAVSPFLIPASLTSDGAFVSSHVEGSAQVGRLSAIVSALAEAATPSSFIPAATFGQGKATGDWSDEITITSSTLSAGTAVRLLLQVELDSTFTNAGGDAFVTASTVAMRGSTMLGSPAVTNSLSNPVPHRERSFVISAAVGETLSIKGSLYAQADALLTGPSVSVVADAGHTALVRLVPLDPGVSYQTASGRGMYLPDTAPPVVSLEAPAEGAHVRGLAGIIVTASDDISGVARIDVTANGVTLGPCTAPGPCPLEIDTTRFPDGPLTVEATAYDFEGNLAAPVRRGLVVDNTAPLLTVPADIVATAASAQGALVAYEAHAVDGIDGPIMPICTPPSGDTFPVATTQVTCTATDAAGNVATGHFSVVVLPPNTAPVVGAISAPSEPVLLGFKVTIVAQFTDADQTNVHTCSINWDDGTSSVGKVTESNGKGTCTGSRTYPSAGAYAVEVTITDDKAASGKGTADVLVIDPRAPLVGGIGTVDTPAGGYPSNPGLRGNAGFVFITLQGPSGSAPQGRTEFAFGPAGMRFRSTQLEALVFSGAKAQYRGSGTINNAGAYGFIVTVTDGQLPGGGGRDRLRMKIWDRTTLRVVYDNLPGAADAITAFTPPPAVGTVIIRR
jgi:hypothetical protein